MEYASSREQERIRISFQAVKMGDGLIIRIFNEYSHIGAVAVGEFDNESSRTSVSVLTRKGHKDDALAQKAAHAVTQISHKPTCVIAGVHLEGITKEEIALVIEITDQLIDEYLKSIQQTDSH